jgi:MATE family multidrug resistance protein
MTHLPHRTQYAQVCLLSRPELSWLWHLSMHSLIGCSVRLCSSHVSTSHVLRLVWGPKPVRLGFIGAPIATAISFNLVSVASIVYGIFFVPKTAWHPISRRCFTSLGVLVQLGFGGVGKYLIHYTRRPDFNLTSVNLGQVASEWWSWELIALAASL